MSTYYEVFVEANINGKWMMVNPFIKRNKDSEPKLVPVCAGSKSWYGDMYNKIREIGKPIDYKKISSELRDWYKKLDEDINEEELEEEFEYFSAVTCTISQFFNTIPKEKIYENHGFVHKNIVAEYKLGNTYEIYDYLDAKEYDKLSSKTKQLYEYFEWDDDESWFTRFKEMSPIISYFIEEYCEINEIYDSSEINFRLVCVVL